MKTVLTSIQPKYCELIANKKKTLEIRKTRPKIKTPFKDYIYCTLPPKNEFFWHHDEEGRRTIGEYANELIRLIDGSVVYDYGMRMCVDGGKLGRMPEIGETSSDNFLCKKVIGEFVCDYITPIFFDSDIRYGEDFPNEYISKICGDSCLSLQELKKYANGKDVFGWHISDLVIYDVPKELKDFSIEDKTAIKNCKHRFRTGQTESVTKHGGWIQGGFGCMKSGIPEWCENCLTKTLTSPPQSWCYVDELR